MLKNLKIPKELIPSDPRFGCGPSKIQQEVIEKLTSQNRHLLGTSHRKSPVKNIVKEIQEGLIKYFNLPNDYVVVLGNGGASLLFDMIGLGLVKKEITHFTCGEFSEKWYKSSKLIPWIKAINNSVEFGKGINGVNSETSDVLAVTLNETSTGVKLSQLPRLSDNCLIAVDATSGAGQVECDVSKTDIFFFSPQKVFASEGGLWIAIMSPKAQKRALDLAEDKTRYVPEIMNWKYAIENSKLNQTYNTPSLTTLFMLNEQIQNMNKIGYETIINQSKEKAKLIYDWAKAHNFLDAYIKEEEFQSTAVATIDFVDRLPMTKGRGFLD